MLTKQTLKFLEQLADNNNKDWFETHRSQYEAAKKEFSNFFDDVFIGVIGFDETINRNQDNSKKIFRINRDVRFSRDKSPYKSNFGAVISPYGMKTGLAGYYIHVEPGNKSGLGGGVHMPDTETLHKVRIYIAENSAAFFKIINATNFKKVFNDLEKGEISKRLPSDIAQDNPAIEYIKLKSFTVWRALSDNDLTNDKLVDTVVNSFKAMHPLIEFFNKAVK